MRQIRETLKFETREEAEQASQAFLWRYHPAGYGSFTSIIRRAEGYEVVTCRWSSCD